MKRFLLLFFILISFLQAEEKRILIGSPIRQKPEILKEFLASLKNLYKITYKADYLFVDDNVQEESKKILIDFKASEGDACVILQADIASKGLSYVCNELTHYWNEDAIWKVAGFKDKMIEKAKEGHYDYLFLIDSDLVLNPMTLEKLILANKEIVSNIFWTAWQPDTLELPQVWISDHYTQYEKGINEEITDEEGRKRFFEFLDKMRKPGVYEVGGLGACTLISKTALQKGISFKKIKNISLWGEDRHFCIRAASLGIDLFVDTHFPAYHIYRESYLEKVNDFKKANEIPRLTLSMIMRNESENYLKMMLEAAKEYITDAVIIDDASTDNSVEVVKEILEDIPVKIVTNSTSKFSNEHLLRKQQWEETAKTHPEWIVFLDADQIFEKKFKEEVKALTNAKDVDAYYFRLYDFWDEEHYREDNFWRAHLIYRPFLVRYKEGLNYTWNETPQHCGSFPLNVMSFPMKYSELRLKHLGWAKEKDRLLKYNRYKALDPDAKYGWKEQYESILDPSPHLLKWEE